MLRVKTNHSDYLIDVENRRFARATRHERANQISQFSEGEWHNYVSMDDIAVGASLFFTLPGGSWLRSTPVLSVAEDQAA